ncbi:MAG TPA: hypothetical protein VFF58_00605 [Candidatus Nitrosotalea sp.]|nr:hypothetical protein [Candidatus Nitrosotalea sp.]
MADYAEAITNRPRPGKKGPKEIRSVEIEKAANNEGHVATHRFKQQDGGPYHESEGPIPFGKEEGHKLVEHLVKHLGIKGVKVSAAAEKDGKNEDEEES